MATNSILSAMVLIYRAYCEAFSQPFFSPESTTRACNGSAINCQGPEYSFTTLRGLGPNCGDRHRVQASRRWIEKCTPCRLQELRPRTAQLAKQEHRHHYNRCTHNAYVQILVREDPALLPPNANVVTLDTSDEGAVGAIELVVKSFHLINEMSSMMGLDPGRPRVPEFGRRLYRLRPDRSPNREGKPPLKALLERKLGGPVHHWPPQVIEATKQALNDYLGVLRVSRFGGIVFDYDDTLCPKADRFGRLPQHVADMIAGLVANGISVGIATGRAVR